MKIRIDRDFFIRSELFILLLLGITQIRSMETTNLLLNILLLAIMAIMNIDTMTIMLFVALPFFNLMNYKMGTTSLYYLGIIIFLVKYFFTAKTAKKASRLLILLGLIILRIPSGDFILLIKWTLLISVLIFTYNEEFFVGQIKDIIKYISFSTLFSSVIGYYMLKTGTSIYTRSYVFTYGIGKTTRFAGLIGDSVFYAQFVDILIAANLIIAFYNDRIVNVNTLLAAALTPFVVITYSKMGFILLIFSYAVFAFSSIRHNAINHNKIYKSLFLLLFSVLFFSVLTAYISSNRDLYVVKNYITRFSSSDLSTGRIKIIKHYIALLGKSWRTLFFAMAQDVYTTPFTTNGINMINRSHNIYLETVCAFGLTASVIIFTWIITRIFKACAGKEYVKILPAAILLVSGLVLHGHFEFHYYALVALAMAFLSCNLSKFDVRKEALN